MYVVVESSVNFVNSGVVVEAGVQRFDIIGDKTLPRKRREGSSGKC